MDSHESKPRDLCAQARRLPGRCGVYLFLDADGRVLYIGKAKCLRTRVGTYFQPAANLAAERSGAIGRMIDRDAVRLEYLICASEEQALRRESRLIKDLQPPCNVAQKRDRRYAYLQITDERFPQVSVTREPLPRGARLYGPLRGKLDSEQAASVLGRVFGVRTCQRQIGPGRQWRPCLRHEIGQCSGPCGGEIGPDAYVQQVTGLRQYMRSRRAVMGRLQESMDQARGEMNFERAAMLRDDLAVMELLTIRRGQKDTLPPRPPAIDRPRALQRLGSALGLLKPLRIILCLDTVPRPCHDAQAQPAGWLALAATYIDGRHYRPLFRHNAVQAAAGPVAAAEPVAEGKSDAANDRSDAATASRALASGVAETPVIAAVAGLAQHLSRVHPLLAPDLILLEAPAIRGIEAALVPVAGTIPVATLIGPRRLATGGQCVCLAAADPAWLLVRTLREECRRVARLLTP